MLYVFHQDHGKMKKNPVKFFILRYNNLITHEEAQQNKQFTPML